MKIPQLQIHTTNAQIGLMIQDPVQHIQQPAADMQIQQPAAELSIQTMEGQLQIDQTQLRADMGNYTFLEFARNAARSGVQVGLEGIARRAREGEQLGDIVHGRNALVAIAKSKNKNMQLKQLGVTFIPSYNAVKLHYTPADVQIDVQKNDAKVDVSINKPIHDYTSGRVLVDLLQQPSIEIDWLV